MHLYHAVVTAPRQQVHALVEVIGTMRYPAEINAGDDSIVRGTTSGDHLRWLWKSAPAMFDLAFAAGNTFPERHIDMPTAG